MDKFIENRYKRMRSLLRQSGAEGKIVVDLGAGQSPISAGVRCRQCFPLDIRADYRPSIVCNFIEGIPLKDSSVDIVVAGEILEHLAQSRLFLLECRRILTRKGILILSTPNIVSLKYRLAFLLGRIPAHAARADYTYVTDKPASQWGHVRDYSFKEVQSVLADHGFHVVAKCSIGMYLRGVQIIPPWLMPISFSDQVIVKAIVCK